MERGKPSKLAAGRRSIASPVEVSRVLHVKRYEMVQR